MILKILIVDDEPIILNLIGSLTKKLRPFWDVTTCLNATEAKERLSNTRYDILLTDINLPVVSGLELASWCRKEIPTLIIAIISAYSEFEFARTAMSLDIKHYILKPIDEAQYEEVLTDLEHEYISKKKNIIKESLNSYVSSRSNYNSQSIEEIMRGYTLMPLLINVGSLSKTSWMQRDTLLSKKNLLEKSKIESFFKDKLFKEQFLWYFEGPFSTIITIVVIPNNQPKISPNIVKHKIDEWLNDQKKLIIVISDKMEYISDIMDFQNFVLTRLTQHIHFEKSSCHYISKTYMSNKLQSELSTGCEILDENKGMYMQFWEKTLTQFKPSETHWFQIVRHWQNNNYSQEMCECELKNFIDIGEAQATNIGYRGRLFYDIHLTLLRNIEKTFTWKSFERKTIEDIEVLCKEIKVFVEENFITREQQLVQDVKKFIHQNYKEKITNEDISQHFSYSIVHISNIFKEICDCTPLDYLNNFRIKKAKHALISKPEMSISQVGDSCGFSDPSYFSRVFKRETGISPDFFRKSMIDNENQSFD